MNNYTLNRRNSKQWYCKLIYFLVIIIIDTFIIHYQLNKNINFKILKEQFAKGIVAQIVIDRNKPSSSILSLKINASKPIDLLECR